MSAGVDARTLRSKLEQQAKQAMSAQQPADVNVYMRWALLLQAELRRLSTTIESERAETRALSEQNLVLRDRLAIHAPGHPLLAGKGVGAGAAAAAASSSSGGAPSGTAQQQPEAPSAGTSELLSTPNLRQLSDFLDGRGPSAAAPVAVEPDEEPGAWRRKFQRVGSAQDGLAAMGELSRPPRQG